MPYKNGEDWVEFTGLRFATKFASREEIIREVRGLFKRRGIEFGHLEIRFVNTKLWGLPHEKFEQRGLEAGDYHPCIVRVSMNKYTCRDAKDFWHVLFHELDHHAWFIQKNQFDLTKPYIKRPHERRAERAAFRNTKRLRKEGMI